ncbi:ABC transporter ATP-binding protein [Prochlorococcus sp. MIT 1307]|uniref:ABC transporter ATP-binding protein n=1 Tax=Prochlorococcus sp. MIT 1307 TaxID=3096219 RepID=UPI002A74CD89|nr:ABC transporter ATP-binding protein [Prochlorococcus sp. MIT 1307]
MPLAAIGGLAEVAVVALISTLFTLVAGQPNSAPIPFNEFLPDDPKLKVISIIILYIGMNWSSSFIKIFQKICQERIRVLVWFDLSKRAQKNIISQPYEYFLNKKYNDFSTSVLINIERVSSAIVLPIMHLTSSLFVVSFLTITILSISKSSGPYLIISLLTFYSLITFIITPYIRFANRQRILLEREKSNILQESVRTIIDVHLTNSESYFAKKYSDISSESFPFFWKSRVLPDLPRALIEPFGITLIFTIGLLPYLSGNQPRNLIEIVPFLATIAVSALKLTAPLQQAFGAFTRLRAGIPDLEVALKLIELPYHKRKLLDNEKTVSSKGIEPRNYIKLNHVKYKYPTSNKLVLDDINITIPVGSRVAFVGKTGSGKTTTANQLLCLLQPTSGSLQVDGINVSESEVSAWQSNCAYVPQSINLLNSNVVENVAYGLEADDIELDRVWESLEAAQIADLVSELPMGLYTEIGDNGIRLSGGQRQRLALARAFYRKSKLLILDEATSALDNQTEAEVMDAIELIGRRCTIVVIAHRLSTIMRSDYIYEFDHGTVKAAGNYQELLEKSQSFKEMINIAKTKLREDDIEHFLES